MDDLIVFDPHLARMGDVATKLVELVAPIAAFVQLGWAALVTPTLDFFAEIIFSVNPAHDQEVRARAQVGVVGAFAVFAFVGYVSYQVQEQKKHGFHTPTTFSIQTLPGIVEIPHHRQVVTLLPQPEHALLPFKADVHKATSGEDYDDEGFEDERRYSRAHCYGDPFCYLHSFCLGYLGCFPRLHPELDGVDYQATAACPAGSSPIVLEWEWTAEDPASDVSKAEDVYHPSFTRWFFMVYIIGRLIHQILAWGGHVILLCGTFLSMLRFPVLLFLVVTATVARIWPHGNNSLVPLLIRSKLVPHWILAHYLNVWPPPLSSWLDWLEQGQHRPYLNKPDPVPCESITSIQTDPADAFATQDSTAVPQEYDGLPDGNSAGPAVNLKESAQLIEVGDPRGLPSMDHQSSESVTTVQVEPAEAFVAHAPTSASPDSDGLTDGRSADAPNLHESVQVIEVPYPTAVLSNMSNKREPDVGADVADAVLREGDIQTGDPNNEEEPYNRTQQDSSRWSARGGARGHPTPSFYIGRRRVMSQAEERHEAGATQKPNQERSALHIEPSNFAETNPPPLAAEATFEAQPAVIPLISAVESKADNTSLVPDMLQTTQNLTPQAEAGAPGSVSPIASVAVLPALPEISVHTFTSSAKSPISVFQKPSSSRLDVPQLAGHEKLNYVRQDAQEHLEAPSEAPVTVPCVERVGGQSVPLTSTAGLGGHEDVVKVHLQSQELAVVLPRIEHRKSILRATDKRRSPHAGGRTSKRARLTTMDEDDLHVPLQSGGRPESLLMTSERPTVGGQRHLVPLPLLEGAPVGKFPGLFVGPTLATFQTKTVDTYAAPQPDTVDDSQSVNRPREKIFGEDIAFEFSGLSQHATPMQTLSFTDIRQDLAYALGLPQQPPSPSVGSISKRTTLHPYANGTARQAAGHQIHISQDHVLHAFRAPSSISQSTPPSLENPGGYSCYINSVVQALMSCQPLIGPFLSHHHPTHDSANGTDLNFITASSEWCTSCVFQNIARSFAQHDDLPAVGELSANQLVNNYLTPNAHRLGPHFKRHRQGDAAEFLESVLMKLGDSEPDVSDAVGCVTATSLTRSCKCGIPSPGFNGAILSVEGCVAVCPRDPESKRRTLNSLQDALMHHFETQYDTCPGCGKPGEKSCSLVFSPAVLLIHLDEQKNRSPKSSFRMSESDVSLGIAGLWSETKEAVTRYELVALIYHVGVDNAGHYMANVRKTDLRGDHTWWHCSDSTVRKISDPRPHHREDTAEVLYFYVRDDLLKDS